MPQDTSPEVRNSDDPQYVEDYPQAFDVPRQRAWGFLAFLACAFGLAVAAKHPSISERVAATAAGASVVATQADASLPSRARDIAVQIRDAALPTAAADEVHEVLAPNTPVASVTHPSVPSATSRSVITFQSPLVVTTEKAVTAVFVLTRSPPLGSRARVHWAARSGTADAAIDFSDASGTTVFASGHSQQAIYVPLRNDLLKEGEETFKLCLRSPRNARLEPGTCAEATIRDDD
jgi:hypothetical protein